MTRIMFRFCGTILAMPLAAWLLPGVHSATQEAAWVAGVILGLLYLILHPLFKLLLTPLNCITLGIGGFLVDVGLVNLTAQWVRGFSIEGFWWSLAIAVMAVLLQECAETLSDWVR